MYNQSIGHAFDLLELLSQEPKGLKMTEIGRRLDLNKSTTYRLLAEMKRRGYVHQDVDRGAYRIGIKFIEFVSSYLNNVELKTEAHALMCRLNELVDRTIYLAIQREDEVVYIDRVTRFGSLREYSIIGQRKPIHSTSLGKSLLMTTPDEEVMEILGRRSMEAYTPNTIQNPQEFLLELEHCRQRGWSIDNEEIEPGVKCFSAPIFDYQNKVIAAISVSWYIDKFSQDTEEILSKHINSIADEISTRMGCVKSKAAILADFGRASVKVDHLEPALSK